jgi:hypothetical protein
MPVEVFFSATSTLEPPRRHVNRLCDTDMRA